jgi:hypothetical protein
MILFVPVIPIPVPTFLKPKQVLDNKLLMKFTLATTHKKPFQNDRVILSF